ncbi:MAG: precorrin-3B C(17)-methyltransferase [Nitrospirae bacterium]|nr:precorrin-3B C(17)-methyltransferase [Nitrospirota bacterium]
MSTGNRVKSQELRVKKKKTGHGRGGERPFAPTAIFYITNNGLRLAQKISELCPGARIIKFTSAGAIHELPRQWAECGNLIFIMATGIVVRTIAPLIKDKKTDPAVVALDEKGRHVISLLSGHLGGANVLAREIAASLNGDAVITTASDVNNLPSIDLWAEENRLVIENWNMLSHTSTKLLNNGALNVYVDQDIGIELPDAFINVDGPESADMIIVCKGEVTSPLPKSKLYLRPKNLVVGIGCNSGTSGKEIEDAVKTVLRKNKLSFLSIHSIATLDRKGSEPGLILFAGKYDLRITTFTPAELNSAVSDQRSAIICSNAVFKATGAYAVAEPAALLAAGTDQLLVPKQKTGNVTVAVAGKKRVKSQELRVKKKEYSKFNIQDSQPLTKLYIVGTGPGGLEHITPRAQEAIRKSDVIVGYGTYLDLITDLIKDKEVVSTGMTQEVDRGRKAVELALSGKTVSVISGGDPGIYAMAGLVFELLKGSRVQGFKGSRGKDSLPSDPRTLGPSDPVVEVIPGISALNACAARLGAPLMHDFATISLSDRLTPWEQIEKRIEAAAMADFVIVIYNPKSKGRQKHIRKAQEIISGYRNSRTPVGLVKAAMRENEKVVITNLEDMLSHDIDMQTTVIIGNSQTFKWGDYLITPRGYEKKFKI